MTLSGGSSPYGIKSQYLSLFLFFLFDSSSAHLVVVLEVGTLGTVVSIFCGNFALTQARPHIFPILELAN
jgi:hypothetical protein